MGLIFLLDEIGTLSNHIKGQLSLIKSSTSDIQSAVDSFVGSELKGASYQSLKDYFSSTFIDLLTAVNNSCDSIESDCSAYEREMSWVSNGETILNEEEIITNRDMMKNRIRELENAREARYQERKERLGLLGFIVAKEWPSEEEVASQRLKEKYEEQLEILKEIEAKSKSHFLASQAEISSLISLLKMDRGSFNLDQGTFVINKEFQQAIDEIKERQVKRLMEQFKLTQTQAENILEVYTMSESEALIQAYQKAAPLDKKSFEYILEGSYEEAFAINPNSLSEGTIAFLADYNIRLKLVGRVDKIEAMTNAIYAPKYQIDANGKPTEVIFNTSYFSLLSNAINSNLEIRNYKILEGMSKEEFEVYLEGSDHYRQLAHYYACHSDIGTDYINMSTVEDGRDIYEITTIKVVNLEFSDDSSFDLEGYTGRIKKPEDAVTYGWSGKQGNLWELGLTWNKEIVATIGTEYHERESRVKDLLREEKLRELAKERDSVYFNAIAGSFKDGADFVLGEKYSAYGLVTGGANIVINLLNAPNDRQKAQEEIDAIYLADYMETFGGVGTYVVKDKNGNIISDEADNICYYNALAPEKAHAWGRYMQSKSKVDFLMCETDEDYDFYKVIDNVLNEKDKDSHFFDRFKGDVEALAKGELIKFRDENGKLDYQRIFKAKEELDKEIVSILGKKIKSEDTLTGHIEDRSKEWREDND